MTKTIREIPILMQTDMARAFIEDRKDVTRRLTGLDMINQDFDEWEYVGCGYNSDKNDGHLYFHFKKGIDTWTTIKSPYGKPGDWLWIRETFYKHIPSFDHLPTNYYYKTDYNKTLPRPAPLWPEFTGWKPSIHMPRVAARLWAENVSIRPERLKDITKEDAVREGIRITNTENNVGAKAAFQILWDRINGKPKKDKPAYPWKSNPWVWRLELKKLSVTGRPALCKCGAIADMNGECEACFNTTIYERGA